MTTTWIEPGDRPAALEVWRTYDRHTSGINEDLLPFCRKHPELGGRPQPSRQQIDQQNRVTAERLRAVFAGDWGPQEQHLRQEGSRQAQQGLSFKACCDLAGAFQRRLLPLLIEDLGPTSPRLAAAIDVLLQFGERSLACLGQAYRWTRLPSSPLSSVPGSRRKIRER